MAESIDPRWAWQPSKATDWDIRKVGHLYRRAGFGATYAELEAGVKPGPEKTYVALRQGGSGQEAFDRQTEAFGRIAAGANNARRAGGWWLYRMLYTPHPLREKM